MLRRMWSGESKVEQEEAIKLSEEEQAWVEEQSRVEEIIRQERRQELRRKRNKSGLSYSDQMRLVGKAPLEGIALEVSVLYLRLYHVHTLTFQ